MWLICKASWFLLNDYYFLQACRTNFFLNALRYISIMKDWEVLLNILCNATRVHTCCYLYENHFWFICWFIENFIHLVLIYLKQPLSFQSLTSLKSFHNLNDFPQIRHPYFLSYLSLLWLFFSCYFIKYDISFPNCL